MINLLIRNIPLILLIPFLFFACGNNKTTVYYPDNYGIISSDTAISVTFQYTDDNNDIGSNGTIFLSGDMNNWSLSSTPLSKMGDTLYSVTFNIVPDTYYYRYIINYDRTVAQSDIVYSSSDNSFDSKGRKVIIDSSNTLITDFKEKFPYNIKLSVELNDSTKDYTTLRCAYFYYSGKNYVSTIFPANNNGLIEMSNFFTTGDTYADLYIYRNSSENDKGYSLIELDNIFFKQNTDTFIGTFELKRQTSRKDFTIYHVRKHSNYDTVFFLSTFNNFAYTGFLSGDNIINPPANVVMSQVDNTDTFSITISAYPGIYYLKFVEISKSDDLAIVYIFYDFDDINFPLIYDWKSKTYKRCFIVK